MSTFVSEFILGGDGKRVAVKVLLRLRLRPVARVLFGHRGPYDPY